MKFFLFLAIFVGFYAVTNLAWVGAWTAEPNYWKPHVNYGNSTDQLYITTKTPEPCALQLNWATNTTEGWKEQNPIKDSTLKTTHAFLLSDLQPNISIKYFITPNNELTNNNVDKLRESVIKDLAKPFIIPGYTILPAKALKTGENYPIKFAVYGDDRPTVFGTNNHYALANAIVKEQPNFVLNVGDLVQTGWSNMEWARFFDNGEELFRSYPLLPTPGNHEYYSGSMISQDSEESAPLYLEAFTLPGNESYYSYNFARTHIISLDISSSDGSKNKTIQTAQLEWLNDDLNNLNRSAIDWVFVLFHYPIASSMQNHYNIWNDILRPIFTSKNISVDAFLVGHIHQYERIWLENASTWEIISAGGGAEIDQWKSATDITPGSKIIELSHSYVMIEINGLTCKISAKYINGKTFDSITLTKQQPIESSQMAQNNINIQGTQGILTNQENLIKEGGEF